MPGATLAIDGVNVPRFVYGTAWKESETQRLTELAIRQGFRAIDTANQRKHYDELSVGKGIAAAIQAGLVTRDDLFLQTKFTFRGGQDHRLPYDPKATTAEQVEQSFASSLEHLGVKSLDSYVLHGPSSRSGLTTTDWDAWRAMEAIHDRGGTRWLGVSNVSLEQLQALHEGARVKPRFVQNRCFAVLGWDHDIRTFCLANALIYQGFSLLTANARLLASPHLIRIARHHARTVNQVVFRFALDVGMLPLTGTTNPSHMAEDLAIFEFALDPAEVATIERIATG